MYLCTQITNAAMRKVSITEQPSHYDHLEQMTIGELLQHINEEDAMVADAVQKAIPQIEALVAAIEPRMRKGEDSFILVREPVGDLVCWMPVNCLPLLEFLTPGSKVLLPVVTWLCVMRWRRQRIPRNRAGVIC